MTHCRINETDAYLCTYTNVIVRQNEHVSRVRICPQTDRQTPGITSIIMELKVKCTCTFYFPDEFLPLLLLVRELISIKLADSENCCNKNRVKGQNLAQSQCWPWANQGPTHDNSGLGMRPSPCKARNTRRVVQVQLKLDQDCIWC